MVKKKQKNKKINYLLLVLLAGIVVLLIFFNLNIWRKRQETERHLERVENELRNLIEEKELLEEEEERRDIDKEIERIAREQLLLRKEGEQVIVISREENGEHIDPELEEEEKGIFQKIKENFLNFFK